MPATEDEILLERLRALLLEQDPQDNEGLHHRLDEIRSLLDNPEAQRKLLAPHMKEQVEDIRENFSEYFGDELTESLRNQIEASRETVIEALYPIIGKLISRYIKAEIARVVESVDQRVSNTFSWAKIKRKIVGIFTGVSENELALKELNPPIIEEVFVIQKQTGLLLGSFSRNDAADQDMIAGMMTAIKSFAEDAFKQRSDELETIQYESFNIHLQSFYSHYMAIAVAGIEDTRFRKRLQDRCLEFAETHMSIPVRDADGATNARISNSLKEFFNEF